VDEVGVAGKAPEVGVIVVVLIPRFTIKSFKETFLTAGSESILRGTIIKEGKYCVTN
jgi:hypothetical protein